MQNAFTTLIQNSPNLAMMLGESNKDHQLCATIMCMSIAVAFWLDMVDAQDVTANGIENLRAVDPVPVDAIVEHDVVPSVVVHDVAVVVTTSTAVGPTTNAKGERVFVVKKRMPVWGPQVQHDRPWR